MDGMGKMGCTGRKRGMGNSPIPPLLLMSYQNKNFAANCI
jgi:hypothetical protein